MVTSGSRDLIVAADFGTSAVKVGLVDPQFGLVARASVPYPLALPEPGAAEQNPQDWWASLAQALAQLKSQVPALAERAAALVFCAQMCGVVPVDAEGQPLRAALIWLDKRSAAVAKHLAGGFPSVSGYHPLKLWRWVRHANGAPAFNGMDPPGKMLWLKRHEPDVFDRAAVLLDVKDWLIHRAAGEFCMTADSANLTWLMDTRPGREGWSPALAQMTGIPLEKMPPIVEGAAIVGRLHEAAAAELGLPVGLPVAGGGGDVTATAIGSGARDDGQLHVCAGTSSWISGFFPGRRLNVACSYATIASSVGYRPLLIATQEAAGSAFGWIGGILGESSANAALASLYADLGSTAATDPFFLPWLSGERVPIDDARLRGAFYGLGLGHDRNAILRSVIEGVAFNTRWMYEKVVREKGVMTEGALPLVGGAAINPLFAQALANALARPVVVGREPQYAGILGAAAIAAPALGWEESPWTGAAAIASRPNTVFEPQPEATEIIESRYRRRRRVAKALVRLNRQDLLAGTAA